MEPNNHWYLAPSHTQKLRKKKVGTFHVYNGQGGLYCFLFVPFAEMKHHPFAHDQTLLIEENKGPFSEAMDSRLPPHIITKAVVVPESKAFTNKRYFLIQENYLFFIHSTYPDENASEA